MNWKFLLSDSESISSGSPATSTLNGAYRLISQNAINVAKETFSQKKLPPPPYSITAEMLMGELRLFDVNYHNRKKQVKVVQEIDKEVSTGADKASKEEMLDSLDLGLSTNNLHTDFLRWEREKAMVFNNIQNRNKKLSPSASITSFDFKDYNLSRESTAFSECHEMILRWLDTCRIATEPIPESVNNAFKKIYANEIISDSLDDIVDIILLCGKSLASKNGLIGCLAVILRYFENFNIRFLEIPQSYSKFDQLSRIIAIANDKYNIDNNKADDEYFYFILYFLLKTGNVDGLEYLASDDSASLWKDYELEPPSLYSRICLSLVNILKNTSDTKKSSSATNDCHLLYLDINKVSVSYNPDTSNYPFYRVLIYNLLLPEISRYKDHPFMKLEPLDDILVVFDKIWYRLHLVLVGSLTMLPQSIAALGKEISAIGLSLISRLSKEATLEEITKKLLLYCKLMCCGGCIFETLRLMMCICQMPTAQQLGIILTSYLDLCGAFSDNQLNFASIQLWELRDYNHDVPYLLKVAFSNRRNVLPDTKICFSLTTVNHRSNLVYAIEENYQELLNGDFLGTINLPNVPVYSSDFSMPDMSVYIRIGPLLSKLTKLSKVGHVSKIAIDLLAKYAIDQKKFVQAFNCYFSVGNIDGSLKVIDSLIKQIVHDNVDVGTSENEHSFNPLIVTIMYDTLKAKFSGDSKLLVYDGKINCMRLVAYNFNNNFNDAFNLYKSKDIFSNGIQLLSTETDNIYLLAYSSLINSIKQMIFTYQMPCDLISESEANYLVDLLDASYKNDKANKKLIIKSVHDLLTFVNIHKNTA